MLTLKEAAGYYHGALMRALAEAEMTCPSMYDVVINPEKKRWCLDLRGPCGVEECSEEGDE
jgi:hypothetical protein